MKPRKYKVTVHLKTSATIEVDAKSPEDAAFHGTYHSFDLPTNDGGVVDYVEVFDADKLVYSTWN